MRVRFGPFTLDSDTRQLLRGEEDVHLSPKAFDVLCLLIVQRPSLVTKDELLMQIWRGAFVLEANLNVLIREVRQALADSAQTPRFVQTVHGRGFRFCGKVTNLDAAVPAEVPTGFWLVGKSATFVLSEGDNVIGRDPRCNIWLDESGDSRRHAIIRVDPENRYAVLQDLESMNGTFVGPSRVESQATLADGDVIVIGSVQLTYRQWSNKPTEKTSPPRIS